MWIACFRHATRFFKGNSKPQRPAEPHRALQSTAEPHVHPSHGALRSPAGVLFLDWQGEKWIAGTPGRPFPRQAGRKGTRKRTPCSHDCRFLDRQGGKGIASTRHVPMTTFSSTGRGERPSQTRTKSIILPFPRLAGGKGYHNPTNSNRESHISRACR